MRRRALIAAPLLLAALLVVEFGCGGGGGGGGPTQPAAPTLTFVPDGAAGASSVALQNASGSSVTTLALQVNAQQVASLYGVAFDLTYPATVLHFVDAAQGSLLGTGGAPVSLQVSEVSSGHLVLGLSRLGNVGAIPSATGVLLTLRFQVNAAGSGPFAFSHAACYDDTASPIGGVQWIAGTVTATR